MRLLVPGPAAGNAGFQLLEWNWQPGHQPGGGIGGEHLQGSQAAAEARCCSPGGDHGGAPASTRSAPAGVARSPCSSRHLITQQAPRGRPESAGNWRLQGSRRLPASFAERLRSDLGNHESASHCGRSFAISPGGETWVKSWQALTVAQGFWRISRDETIQGESSP
jgi:hypothetical protein